MPNTDPVPHSAPWPEQISDDQDQLDKVEITAALTERYREAPNEEIAQERYELVKRIRDRDPLDIAHNTERALAGIEQFYVDNNLHGKRGMGRALAQARGLRGLRSKADVFEKTFDQTLFSDIEHGAPDLGDEVELKSPATLAHESGVSVREKARYTGALDIAMGNTDYVFANTKALKSVAGHSRNHYKITSDNGYVVPTDIAVMYPTNRMFGTRDNGVMQLELYADNIHAIPGFKKVFALYSAALFDSPDDALGFYQTFRHVMNEARRWDLDEREDGTNYHRWAAYGPHSRDNNMELGQAYVDQDARANDRSHAITLAMRELVERYNIYPPMEPEFQFRDKVAATRSE